MTSARVSPTAPDGLHEILTPEGVPLRFVVARAGDRIGAFALDLLIVLLLVLILGIVGAVGYFTSGWILAFALLAIFLVQNFYFTCFELRGRGRTPGKRALGLRVIDRRGDSLGAEAVFTRNLTRNIEVFLPLMILLAPGQVFPGAPGWAALLACLWIFVCAALPLFNRERLRIGDLLAGTIVVRAPRAMLLPDLGGRPTTGASQPSAYVFRPDQLDIYGIYELQVLEGLLRNAGPHQRDALATVCDRIKRKIGWDEARRNVEPYRFLMDFYAAQRQSLEGRMRLGRRQEYKRVDRPPERSPDGGGTP